MFRSTCTLIAATILTGVFTPAVGYAQEKDESPAPLNEAQQKFVDLLNNATMTGRFSIEGRETPPKPETYQIESVSRNDGDNWTVKSRVKYGDLDVVVPVPVQVKWAGDTPMIQVTDLSIPLIGEGFTARVLFYGDRYAGTWSHGKVGGHMWGTLSKTKATEEAKP